MTTGQAAMIVLAWRYLGGMLDPFVNLTEFHRLAYFMQESGEPLGLEFAESSYGPHAGNIFCVLKDIGISDDPSKSVVITKDTVKEAEKFLEPSPETLKRLDRISDLIDGYESPFGMSLLSTILWVVKDGARTLPEIVACFYALVSQKDSFKERHVVSAAKWMAEQGWIEIGLEF
jgi:hypothetical protein